MPLYQMIAKLSQSRSSEGGASASRGDNGANVLLPADSAMISDLANWFASTFFAQAWRAQRVFAFFATPGQFGLLAQIPNRRSV